MTVPVVQYVRRISGPPRWPGLTCTHADGGRATLICAGALEHADASDSLDLREAAPYCDSSHSYVA
jgi:hypothetical protein